MEKRIINPWQWQDQRGYAQAVEVRRAESTLYISGQTATNAEGKSSAADMRTQLTAALQNLELVIREAGYRPDGIVKLNVYTTSSEEFTGCFDVFLDWATKHGVKQTSTLLEVKGLFETLKVELEAVVVK
ncbi:RidA family protein [Negadavirga shengliensis]|uniref:RidA family protein n=1 Tax=Negadavirga shengliensis TaxID=1389218 RepID=A0ABV9SWA3_9BACT